jgi:hypothetical protein
VPLLIHITSGTGKTKVEPANDHLSHPDPKFFGSPSDENLSPKKKKKKKKTLVQGTGHCAK